jgi:hypothetical protein
VPLRNQLIWLLVLAIPTACVSWTVTHEEVLREARDYCVHQTRTCRIWIIRKLFYLFTCEYCFSHYVAAFFVYLANYRLLCDGWRGFLIAWLSVVWVANQYMSAFARLRLEIADKRLDVKQGTGQADRERAGQK